MALKQKNTSTFLIKAVNRFQVSIVLITLTIVFILIAQTSHSKSFYSNGSGLQSVSPLMTAANSEDIEGVKFFAKAGRGAINKKNAGGATALHIASRNKNLEIVQILIGSGADVNAVDNEIWTPLMRAAASGNSEIVSELLKNGAKANKRNSLDETAIIHATNSGCSVCLESILNYMDYKKMDEQYLDEQFEEAFLIANKKNDVETKNVLTRYKDGFNKGEVLTPLNNTLNNNGSDLEEVVIDREEGESKNYVFKDKSAAVDDIIAEDQENIINEDVSPIISEDMNKIDSISRIDYFLVTGRDGTFIADKKVDDIVKRDGNKQKFFFNRRPTMGNESNKKSDFIDIEELDTNNGEKRRFYFKRNSNDKTPMDKVIKQDNSEKNFLFRRHKEDKPNQSYINEPIIKKKSEKNFLFRRNKSDKMLNNDLSKKSNKGRSFSFNRSREASRELNVEKEVTEVKKRGIFSFNRKKENNKPIVSKGNSFRFTR